VIVTRPPPAAPSRAGFLKGVGSPVDHDGVTPPEVLASIWARDGRSLIPSAHDVVSCVNAWIDDTATIARLAESARTAHDLAGSLGLFGFLDLAMMAGELEDQLELMLDGDLDSSDQLEAERTRALASALLTGVRTAALTTR
jgi:HPt (histidine-containing phosphotransfer) domain-containing protein